MEDKLKLAFLMIARALANEEDRLKREEMLIQIEGAVFRYTFAADNAIDKFLQTGVDELEILVKRGEIAEQ